MFNMNEWMKMRTDIELNQLNWHWGEQWTWQKTKDNGGHSFVPIAAKWLASGTDDDDYVDLSSVLFCFVLFCSIVCSVLFHYIRFGCVLLCSALVCSVLLSSVLLCSILLGLYPPVPFCSILFCFHLFCHAQSHTCSFTFLRAFSDYWVEWLLLKQGRLYYHVRNLWKPKRHTY